MMNSNSSVVEMFLEKDSTHRNISQLGPTWLATEDHVRYQGKATLVIVIDGRRIEKEIFIRDGGGSVNFKWLSLQPPEPL
jgi:hypothetical protein